MPRSSASSLVGRGAELDRLRRVAVASAPRQMAVVWGEAGLGKSALLEAVGEAAREAGLRVLAEAARPLQQDVPYALVADLFDLRPQAREPARAELGRLIAGEDPAQPYARALAVTERLVDLLSVQGATVFLVDDLHQADRLSLLVLDRLMRRAPQLDVRAVLATRPTSRAEVLSVVNGAEPVELRPLTEREGVEVLTEMLGTEPGPNLLALMHGAAGNPLFVAELGRAAASTAAVVSAAGQIDLPSSTAPATFRATMVARIETLPPATVAALRAGAVLGTTLDVGVIAALAGTSPLEALEALRPAVAQGLVVGEDGDLAFRHELVRDALYRDMPQEVRAKLHRSAADAVALALAATHLQAAGPPFTEADLDVLRASAVEALRVDGRRAAELSELVLAHTPRDSPDRVRWRARRAHSLVLAGDLDGAAGALLSLERDGHAADLGVALAMLEAQGARDQPDPDLARRLWERAIRAEERDFETLGVIAYHAARANTTGPLDGMPDDTVEMPVDARVHFLLVRAMQAAADGDFAQATELARHGYTLARDEPAGVQVALRAAHVLGMFGSDLEPFRAETIEALENATRWAETGNHAGLVPIVHGLLGQAYWAAGDWEQAEVAYRACVSAAEEAVVPRWQADALLSLCHLAADRGESRTARAHLEACDEVAWGDAGDRAVPGWLRRAAIEARIAYGAGRDAEAVALWTADLEDPGTGLAAMAVSAMDVTVAALGLGDRAAIAVAADRLKRYSETGPPVGMVRPLVLAARDGDARAAAEAAEHGRPAPVYGFAKMAEIAGLVARDAGDEEAAVRWLREALAGWERCGAAALRQRTAAWLRALGVHTRGRSSPRALDGWGSLTEAERRVVAVVAEGVVYREAAERLHLSRRTVETHVSSALRKLNLRNRSELLAEYWRLAGS